MGLHAIAPTTIYIFWLKCIIGARCCSSEKSNSLGWMRGLLFFFILKTLACMHSQVVKKTILFTYSVLETSEQAHMLAAICQHPLSNPFLVQFMRAFFHSCPLFASAICTIAWAPWHTRSWATLTLLRMRERWDCPWNQDPQEWGLWWLHCYLHCWPVLCIMQESCPLVCWSYMALCVLSRSASKLWVPYAYVKVLPL